MAQARARRSRRLPDNPDLGLYEVDDLEQGLRAEGWIKFNELPPRASQDPNFRWLWQIASFWTRFELRDRVWHVRPEPWARPRIPKPDAAAPSPFEPLASIAQLTLAPRISPALPTVRASIAPAQPTPALALAPTTLPTPTPPIIEPPDPVNISDEPRIAVPTGFRSPITDSEIATFERTGRLNKITERQRRSGAQPIPGDSVPIPDGFSSPVTAREWKTWRERGRLPKLQLPGDSTPRKPSPPRKPKTPAPTTPPGVDPERIASDLINALLADSGDPGAVLDRVLKDTAAGLPATLGNLITSQFPAARPLVKAVTPLITKTVLPAILEGKDIFSSSDTPSVNATIAAAVGLAVDQIAPNISAPAAAILKNVLSDQVLKRLVLPQQLPAPVVELSRAAATAATSTTLPTAAVITPGFHAQAVLTPALDTLTIAAPDLIPFSASPIAALEIIPELATLATTASSEFGIAALTLDATQPLLAASAGQFVGGGASAAIAGSESAILATAEAASAAPALSAASIAGSVAGALGIAGAAYLVGRALGIFGPSKGYAYTSGHHIIGTFGPGGFSGVVNGIATNNGAQYEFLAPNQPPYVANINTAILPIYRELKLTDAIPVDVYTGPSGPDYVNGLAPVIRIYAADPAAYLARVAAAEAERLAQAERDRIDDLQQRDRTPGPMRRDEDGNLVPITIKTRDDRD